MANLDITTNKFTKNINLTNQTTTINLPTKGKYVDRDIEINLNVQPGDVDLQLSAENQQLNVIEDGSVRVSSSTTKQQSSCCLGFTATASLEASCATSAGYITNGTSTVTTSAISAVELYYIDGVTLVAGDVFTITVPNGSASNNITFTFSVDNNNNVSIV